MAIVAALAAGVAGGAGKIADQAVINAYNALKDLLRRELGGERKVVKAAEAVEAKPQSKAPPVALSEEVVAASAPTSLNNWGET